VDEGVRLRSRADEIGAAFEGTSVGLLLLDRDGAVIVANRAAHRLLPVHDPLEGKRLAELPTVVHTPLGDALAAAARDGERRSVVFAGRGPTGHGVRIRAEVTAPTRESGYRVVTLEPAVGELSGSPAELFYEAFLASRDAIEVTDREGFLVDVNPAFERIYGYRREECIGRKPNLVRSSKTRPEVYDQLWSALLDANGGHWSGEIVNRDRQGRDHTVLLTIDGIRDPEGRITHFVGVATDVSEQRILQLQAIRQERLVSLGQLAAGVAHEINTPLANIRLVAESLQRRTRDDWVRSRAESIAQQVDSAAKIVRGLLDFGRAHSPVVAPTDLVEVCHEAIAFLRGKQSPDVTVTELHASPALPVLANRVQMLQVLVNLVNNAVDAMNDRGELRVESRAVDGCAEVAVSDQGTGIPDEVMPHLFEPFFTTKPPGKGTGLGLSIVHGIVQSHGGEIRVTTSVGHGSTFTVRLPLAPRPAPGSPETAGAPG
jgi:PAS domain S-box-containing protein